MLLSVAIIRHTRCSTRTREAQKTPVKTEVYWMLVAEVITAYKKGR
jgi:hypothetical protein